MKLIESFLPADLIDAFGWMILHSLWQGAVISVVLAFVMILTRKFSAKSRYFIAFVAILFMPATAVYTFVRHYNPVKTTGITEIQTAVTGGEIITGSPSAENTANLKAQQNGEDIAVFKLSNYTKYFYEHIPLVVTLWLLGMLVFTLKFLGGLAYTQRLKYYRVLPVSEQWQQTFQRLKKSLNLQKGVRILQSTLVKVPMVIGYFKPVVLIPVSAFTGLSPGQLETVIMHELAHIFRNDYLINILQSIVEIVFFYHPAVWWMSRVVRTEREHCCDDIAIEKSGDSMNFARALANIQEQVLSGENLAMAIGSGNNSLLKRIKRLLNQPNMRTNFTEGFTASCIIFAGILVMMINTGSSKPIVDKNTKMIPDLAVTRVFDNVGDTTKGAAKSKTVSTSEDELFYLEQGAAKEAAVDRSNDVESLIKEAQKARQEAEMKKEEAEKMRQKAEFYKQEAEEEREKAGAEKDDIHLQRAEELMKKARMTRQEAELRKQEAEKARQVAELKRQEAEKTREAMEFKKQESEKEMQERDPEKREQEKARQKEGKETNGSYEHNRKSSDLEDEIMEGVEAGLKDMDIDVVADEVVDGAAAGISQMDLNLIVREAVEGINKGIEEADANAIANEIVQGIDAAIHEMDLNVIAGEVMSGLRAALKEIDVNDIVNHMDIHDNQENFTGDHEQLKILNKGTGTWNKWRDDHPGITPDLRGADLSEAKLISADLHDALLDNADMKEAVLDWANLEGASLQHAMLKEATFNGARMMRADFSWADMKEVSLHGQLLRNTIFSGTNLREADLSGADLRESDLSKADLHEASLEKADLRGANLRGANLAEAAFTGAQLNGAVVDKYTVLPDEFNIEEAGMVWGK